MANKSRYQLGATFRGQSAGPSIWRRAARADSAG